MGGDIRDSLLVMLGDRVFFCFGTLPSVPRLEPTVGFQPTPTHEVRQPKIPDRCRTCLFQPTPTHEPFGRCEIFSWSRWGVGFFLYP